MAFAANSTTGARRALGSVHEAQLAVGFNRRRLLLAAVLPRKLSKMVNWGAIEKVPVELLDKDLSEKRTDMVWRLPLHGRRAWLYVDFFLEDLQVRPDDQIASWEMDAVGKLTLLLLKHGRTAPDMLAWVSGWRGLFAATEQQWDAALPRFVCYIMSVREDVTAQQLRKDPNAK
jgi:hypothetical protein